MTPNGRFYKRLKSQKDLGSLNEIISVLLRLTELKPNESVVVNNERGAFLDLGA